MPSRVLLVDDDEFARAFARTVLERAGFEVVEAEDVASAIATASESDPAAVVTDWHLPDGDGGTLARNLHHLRAMLPVIVVTGDIAGIESHPEIAPRFAGVLSKPYVPSALEKAIREALMN
jgi:two-component system chemotaxis response regulator CheY